MCGLSWGVPTFFRGKWVRWGVWVGGWVGRGGALLLMFRVITESSAAGDARRRWRQSGVK